MGQQGLEIENKRANKLKDNSEKAKERRTENVLTSDRTDYNQTLSFMSPFSFSLANLGTQNTCSLFFPLRSLLRLSRLRVFLYMVKQIKGTYSGNQWPAEANLSTQNKLRFPEGNIFVSANQKYLSPKWSGYR